jgi:hypothetical protein
VFTRRGAVAAALVALCVAAPAAVAHEGNPNYRSEVRAITPAVAGLDARVLNFDDRIEFVYTGDRDLIVEGYRGEPYLRFRPDGRVELNRRSPAGYLNEDRFAQVEVPGGADQRARPDWRVVAHNGRYDWHDHRIHWMSEGTRPSQIDDESERTKVFDWRLPIEAGGQAATVSGTLTWVGRDEGGFPLAAAASLAAAVIAGALLIAFVRRGRRRSGTREEAW